MLAIIQARSSSKRFKNKVLKKINGKTIIFHVYQNVKKSKNINKIIVATSNKYSDDRLASHLKKKKIKIYRGDLNNVASRFLEVANKEKVKYFFRISGDSPLIDFKIIDQAYQIYKNSKEKKFDIITNIFPRTFPKGQSVELVKTNLLKKNINKFSYHDKEHVTKYFYKNHKKFKIRNFRFKGLFKGIKQAVDTKKDLELLIKKFKKKF